MRKNAKFKRLKAADAEKIARIKKGGVDIMQTQAAVRAQNFTMLDKRTYSLVNDYSLSDDVLNELVGFFTIFSDRTRLKIVSALAISEMCVSDLSNVLKVNQTTLSHQLRLLKNLDAVVSRREGKVIFYSLKDELLSDVMLKGVEFLGA